MAERCREVWQGARPGSLYLGAAGRPSTAGLNWPPMGRAARGFWAAQSPVATAPFRASNMDALPLSGIYRALFDLILISGKVCLRRLKLSCSR